MAKLTDLESLAIFCGAHEAIRELSQEYNVQKNVLEVRRESLKRRRDQIDVEIGEIEHNIIMLHNEFEHRVNIQHVIANDSRKNLDPESIKAECKENHIDRLLRIVTKNKNNDVLSPTLQYSAHQYLLIGQITAESIEAALKHCRDSTLIAYLLVRLEPQEPFRYHLIVWHTAKKIYCTVLHRMLARLGTAKRDWVSRCVKYNELPWLLGKLAGPNNEFLAFHSTTEIQNYVLKHVANRLRELTQLFSLKEEKQD